jgi:hypothetical protein
MKSRKPRKISAATIQGQESRNWKSNGAMRGSFSLNKPSLPWTRSRCYLDTLISFTLIEALASDLFRPFPDKLLFGSSDYIDYRPIGDPFHTSPLIAQARFEVPDLVVRNRDMARRTTVKSVGRVLCSRYAVTCVDAGLQVISRPSCQKYSLTSIESMALIKCQSCLISVHTNGSLVIRETAVTCLRRNEH